ncbi:MAG TPA: hypothetical protein VGO59_05270 [Verrucomicrobiae bacterium]|jgi:hypothetical protein
MSAASAASGPKKKIANRWILLGLLSALLLVLFAKSLDPHQVLFANDVPLGARKAESNSLPGRFTGTWSDLSWLGGAGPAASPSITMLLATVFPAVAYLKIYAPFTLLFLGFSAWVFFRQLKFSPVVCVLGGVAAGLNSHFLSIACWGLGNWNLAAGCAFLAMGALYAKSIPKVWERAVLAGLAVGMGVMEGYDVGAILSIYIGAFILFRFFNNDDSTGQQVANALVAETLVVIFAGIIAYHTMHTLVTTEVEGVALMGQDAETKLSRWRSATQWSLPKAETLQIMVPGLFGYRLSGNISETDRSSAYWGRIGQDPRIARIGSDDAMERSNALTEFHLPTNFLASLDTPNRESRTDPMIAITKKTGIYWRYSGSGETAGVIVSLLAFFGLANIFRKDGLYTKSDRRAICFWGLAALFSLLAAWGRYGFIYQLLYKMPYMSTIRNPIKFMHPFHIAWLILAGYGMEALYRRAARTAAGNANDMVFVQITRKWSKMTGMDRGWAIFTMILAGAAVAGTVLMFVCRPQWLQYLRDQSFTPLAAMNISHYGLLMCVEFLVFLIAGIVVIAAVLSGAWTGTRSKMAWGALGLLMVCDMARADYPWIHYYDYNEKYALNPVTDFLLEKPWEHRVIGKLEPRGPGSGITPYFGQLYFFWLQNDFPYHNIQTLDFPQMAHMPDLDRLYLKAFELNGSDIYSTDLRPAVRLWELTNTRYILGTANAVELLNDRTGSGTFKLDGLFNMVRKPDLTSVGDAGDLTVVQSGTKGEYGIVEYTRALPRAKLFSNWLTTNDDDTLKVLSDQSFDPWKTVLIAPKTPVAQAQSDSTADPGTVSITDYHSKNVRLQADAKTASILLLNDRFGADWQVRVDGARQPMLRCNYIMRGVYLTPGHHVVDFAFRPPLGSLYVSVSAIIIGAILAGFLIATRKPEASAPAPIAPAPVPAPKPTSAPAPKPVSAAPAKQKPGGAKAKKG